MRTLDIPEYTPSRTRCNAPFLGFLRSFSPKTPCMMHQFRLSHATTPSPHLALDPCKARRPSTPLSPDAPGCIRHQRALRVTRRRLRSHRSPLKPPLRFTLAPNFVGYLLALLKERYKNNKTTQEKPPSPISLFLSRGGVAVGS